MWFNQLEDKNHFTDHITGSGSVLVRKSQHALIIIKPKYYSCEITLFIHFFLTFICRYNLAANDSVQASESQHALYDDIAESQQEVKYLAGGAAQNTIRVAQVINIAH